VDVEQHHSRRIVPHGSERFLSGCGDPDLETERPQQLSHQQAMVAVVVYDEDGFLRRGLPQRILSDTTGRAPSV